jgi:hypothetical protein
MTQCIVLFLANQVVDLDTLKTTSAHRGHYVLCVSNCVPSRVQQIPPLSLALKLRPQCALRNLIYTHGRLYPWMSGRAQGMSC